MSDNIAARACTTYYIAARLHRPSQILRQVRQLLGQVALLPHEADQTLERLE
jgi:hypothetical protein